MNPIVSPLKPGDQGPAVADLQDALVLLVDRKVIQGAAPPNHPTADELVGLAVKVRAERTQSRFADATRQLVIDFQNQQHLGGDQLGGVVETKTAAALNAALDKLGVLSPPPAASVVSGRVYSAERAGIGGLHIEVIDRNVGANVTLAEDTSDDAGRYSLSYHPEIVTQQGKTAPDLQVLVSDGMTVLGASEVRYGATPSETLDVVLPVTASSALLTEYATLTGDIAHHYTGRLADLQESADLTGRQDISYLANKTGWDARAVAMAALAEQFSARTAGPAGAAPAIAPAWFYALFRAGVAADEAALHRADAATVTTIWNQAIEQGVIPSSLAGSVSDAVAQWQRLSAQESLIATAPAGVSPMMELLSASGLTGAQQQDFATLYAAHRTDPAAFWTAVEQGSGAPAAARLQTDGKLAFLTLNNAPLMTAVRNQTGGDALTDLRQLAQAGYHRADKWLAALGADIAIPQAIPGDTADAKRANYADYLAAQVRLSYPTTAVASLVKSGDLPVTSPDTVSAFLNEHDASFDIGSQPVERYVAVNHLQVAPDTVAQIKRLQRVYQVTPSDQAMAALLHHGFDAAYRIAQLDRASFVRDLSADIGADQAGLVYDKARQTHNATLNIAISYLTARNGISLGAAPLAADGQAGSGVGQVLRPAPIPPTAADATGVVANPTLESLFGAMDFCACEHCRSVLSPAAYLVDLLQFLDRAPSADDAAAGKVNPQQALLQRRPDLQHLPLSCENTNTALPYIDMVNETMEYFIANDVQKLSLQGYTGHDTDGAATEDLLASPQFVMDAAYTLVGAEFFPTPLPFNRPLQNLRQLFTTFGVPLAAAMEGLRSTEDLERGSSPYGWRDILMEQLGLSSEEHQILTDSAAVPLARLYGFAAATADSDVIAALSNAKSYARRVGTSYEDLVGVLQTRFVNPASTITLVDPASGTNDGNFDTLEFRDSAGGQNPPARLGVPAFVRLWRFIRLWNKTGWSIASTDAGICALYRADLTALTANDVDTVAALDAGFSTLLPRLGVAVRVMNSLGATADRALLPLLACWSDIGTSGEGALYHQMFTNPTLLARDSAFAPDSNGNVLQDPNAKLLDHAETLRAAFNLTADELARIVAAFGFDAGTPLTLTTISAVYRRGWLARALRLSVRELLALMAITGLNPFALPDPARPDITRLIALVDAMKQGGLTPAAALYLIWNQDISGKSAPDPAWGLELARTLRADFADIDDQFTAIDDPAGNVAEARMAQVYGQATADTFFSLLDDTFTVDVAYTNDTPTLASGITAADPGIAYDDFTHRLSHTGRVTTTKRDALQAVPGASAAFLAAVDGLFTRSEDLIGSFFTAHPELKPLYDTYQASTDPVEQKRAALLAAFRPELAARRKRQQALQRLSAAASVDLAYATTLLDPDAAPYSLHAAGQSERPVLDDVIALQTPGLAATFYFRATATGTADLAVTTAAPMYYAANSANPLPPNRTAGQPISGLWQGRLEAPDPGYYNIVVDTDTQATVSLTIDGKAQPLVQNATAWRNATAMPLNAGRLYDVALTVTNVKDTLRLQWETPKRPREVIPGRYLYPPAVLTPFADAYVRFLKLAALSSTLQLTGAEIAHLATDSEYQINGDGWLNALPASGDPASAVAEGLLAALEALLAFTAVKAALSAGDDQLLAVLDDPATATATEDAPLFALTHWDRGSLNDLLTHLGHATADLTSFNVFRRVYDAFTVITPLGTPTAALIRAATNAPDQPTVSGFEDALRARHADTDWRTVIRPVNDTMRDLRRNALVTYILQQLAADPATAHIDTADRLFEYFLMDVQMDSCMLTSRIRHALSSVQLFTERCLMNLEPTAVLPADAAEQWSWMKRYRVWEANRKVFLWPENWLEPELREDKSPFFKDTEAELQQSDITEDSASAAYLNYLAKLEEVAKLEPCGTYYAEPTASADEVIHVVGRTAGAHRKYYSRRYEYGSWTPWEQIKLDIEDNPVIPYVWKGRLLLFWLRLIKSAPGNGQPPPPHRSLGSLTTDDLPGQHGIEVRAMLCWSEYYNGKWQAAKTSDPDRPTMLDTVFSERYDRRALHLGVYPEGDGLRFYIKEGPTWFWRRGTSGNFELCQIWPGSFLFYNTHSLPVRGDDDVVYLGVSTSTLPSPTPITLPPSPVPPSRRELAGADNRDFALHYVDAAGADLTRDILRTQIPFEVVTPRHDLTDVWDAPLFFADSRHAFEVSTTEQPVWIRTFGGYGLPIATGDLRATAIPELVLPTAPPPKPKVWNDSDGMASDLGLIDRDPSQRLVSEDAYIRRALPDTSTVKFGGRLVGPWGALSEPGTEQ
jgi:hypothetical protein